MAGREVQQRAVIILVANDGTLLAAPNLQNPRALIKNRGMPLLEYQTRGQLDAGVETASYLSFAAINEPTTRFLPEHRYISFDNALVLKF